MNTGTIRQIGPWTAIALVIAAFVALEFTLPALRAAATADMHIDTARATVAVRAISSIMLVWLLFTASWIVLRLRGKTLRDIGWRQPARIWGWLLAAFFAALYGGATMMGMMKAGAPALTDWSFFRIAIAVGIAISAGICEETVLRGFVMSEARDAGLHWTLQLLLSALLFGLAHAGWGALGGQFTLARAIGPVSATSILGLMMGATYLAGGRSLTPAIVAHGVIDLLVEPWLLLYAVTGGHF